MRCTLAGTITVALFLGGGCPFLPPSNVDLPDPPRDLLSDVPGASVLHEKGIDDAVWIAIEKQRGPGTVGGYLSAAEPLRAALILVLPGSSTFQDEGTDETAYRIHRDYASIFRTAGYRTFVPVLRQCGTAYGDGDLADALEIVDWLERDGREAFAFERLYAVGFSTGATVTTLMNRRRDFTAVVSMSGITQPDQFEQYWPLYESLANWFPSNEGFCQLGMTLQTYGPPGSPGWDALNSVSRIEEFRGPMLFMHGTDDVVFVPENLLNLQNRYLKLIGEGAQVVDLDFIIRPGGSHFFAMEELAVPLTILNYFERFETPAAPAFPVNDPAAVATTSSL